MNDVMQSPMMQDPTFWYSVAFVIFLLVAFIFARKPTLNWLDAEIVKVRRELDQARQLRKEAEASLAEYTSKQAAAMADAKDIIRRAQAEAEQLKAKAETDLKTALARQEQQAMSRIRMAENEALIQVRNATIDMAMQMVRKALADQVDDNAAARMVDQAINELPKASPAAKAKSSAKAA